MRFNLVHIVPDPPLHGPLGYRETIETLQWGLSTLGHDVQARVNEFAADRVNIVVGAQLLHPQVIESLPENSIVYNLEQIAHLRPEELNPVYRSAAARLQIWDYSAGNVAVLRQLRPVKPVQHVPIGWAPVLERIEKNAGGEDIEVLMYGVPSQPRLVGLAHLAAAGLTVVYACGMYGPARDALIARSKVIVNIKGVHRSNVFEVVRVSYLLGNAKAVVSDIYPDSIVDPDMRDAVTFAPFDQIAAECARLVKDAAARRERESTGQRIMRARDVRQYLAPAIATMQSA